MAINHAHQAALNFFPCFVPRHFNMHAIALHHRLAQTVGVFMQLLQRAALRTDKAMTEHIVLVTADTNNLFLRVHGNLQATGGLA